MPQLDQAKKALRSSQRKRVVNDRWRRRVHDAVAAAGSDPKALPKAQSTLDRAARRNIIHPNKAARLKQRLSQAISRNA